MRALALGKVIVTFTIAVTMIGGLIHGILMVLLWPASAIRSMVEKLSQTTRQAEFVPFANVPTDDLSVREVFCPTRHKVATVTVSGLEARKNPETRYWPLDVANCTMPCNAAVQCDRRCLDQLLRKDLAS